MMPFVSELVYSHVVETFIASYVLITVPFGVVLNTIAVLDFPLLLPAVSGTSLFVLFGSILLCFVESSNQLSHSYGFSALVNFETVSFIFKTLFLLISSLIVTIYRNTMPNGQGFELDQLVLMALVGMLLLIVSNDLLLVYLAVELQSLCFYAIIGLNCYSELAIEASLKYFLIGALASCLLLFGFSLIYFGYGTTLFDNLFLLSYSTVYFSYNSLGIILVLIAFLIKLGVAPFHVWICDVYEGSLTAITAFFATAPKLVLVLLFFKMFHVAFVSQISVWGLLISLCGIISVIWATFAGLYQKRIKRLMAYSAIGHVGFISLGLGCCTVYSVQSVSTYIGLYVFMSLAGFLALLLVNIVQAKYLINWSSLSETNSFLSLTFAIVLLATAGIPPLAGFITKLFVLFALIEQSFIALSILLVIFSCISCFYYIRLIKLMFFSKPLNSRLWVACNDRNAETLYLAVILLITLVLVRPDVVFLSTSLVSLAIV